MLGSGENDRLTHLMRIVIDGPEFDAFDPAPVVDYFCSTAVRRPNQKKRKPYAKRERRNIRLSENNDFVSAFFNCTLEEETDDEDCGDDEA